MKKATARKNNAAHRNGQSERFEEPKDHHRSKSNKNIKIFYEHSNSENSINEEPGQIINEKEFLVVSYPKNADISPSTLEFIQDNILNKNTNISPAAQNEKINQEEQYHLNQNFISNKQSTRHERKKKLKNPNLKCTKENEDFCYESVEKNNRIPPANITNRRSKLQKVDIRDWPLGFDSKEQLDLALSQILHDKARRACNDDYAPAQKFLKRCDQSKNNQSSSSDKTKNNLKPQHNKNKKILFNGKTLNSKSNISSEDFKNSIPKTKNKDRNNIFKFSSKKNSDVKISPQSSFENEKPRNFQLQQDSESSTSCFDSMAVQPNENRNIYQSNETKVSTQNQNVTRVGTQNQNLTRTGAQNQLVTKVEQQDQNSIYISKKKNCEIGTQYETKTPQIKKEYQDHVSAKKSPSRLNLQVSSWPISTNNIKNSLNYSKANEKNKNYQPPVNFTSEGIRNNYGRKHDKNNKSDKNIKSHSSDLFKNYCFSTITEKANSNIKYSLNKTSNEDINTQTLFEKKKIENGKIYLSSESSTRISTKTHNSSFTSKITNSESNATIDARIIPERKINEEEEIVQALENEPSNKQPPHISNSFKYANNTNVLIKKFNEFKKNAHIPNDNVSSKTEASMLERSNDENCILIRSNQNEKENIFSEEHRHTKRKCVKPIFSLSNCTLKEQTKDCSIKKDYVKCSESPEKILNKKNSSVRKEDLKSFILSQFSEKDEKDYHQTSTFLNEVFSKDFTKDKCNLLRFDSDSLSKAMRVTQVYVHTISDDDDTDEEIVESISLLSSRKPASRESSRDPEETGQTDDDGSNTQIYSSPNTRGCSECRARKKNPLSSAKLNSSNNSYKSDKNCLVLNKGNVSSDTQSIISPCFSSKNMKSCSVCKTSDTKLASKIESTGPFNSPQSLQTCAICDDEGNLHSKVESIGAKYPSQSITTCSVCKVAKKNPQVSAANVSSLSIKSCSECKMRHKQQTAKSIGTVNTGNANKSMRIATVAANDSNLEQRVKTLENSQKKMKIILIFLLIALLIFLILLFLMIIKSRQDNNNNKRGGFPKSPVFSCGMFC